MLRCFATQPQEKKKNSVDAIAKCCARHTRNSQSVANYNDIPSLTLLNSTSYYLPATTTTTILSCYAMLPNGHAYRGLTRAIQQYVLGMYVLCNTEGLLVATR